MLSPLTLESPLMNPSTPLSIFSIYRERYYRHICIFFYKSSPILSHYLFTVTTCLPSPLTERRRRQSSMTIQHLGSPAWYLTYYNVIFLMRLIMFNFFKNRILDRPLEHTGIFLYNHWKDGSSIEDSLHLFENLYFLLVLVTTMDVSLKRVCNFTLTWID